MHRAKVHVVSSPHFYICFVPKWDNVEARLWCSAQRRCPAFPRGWQKKWRSCCQTQTGPLSLTFDGKSCSSVQNTEKVWTVRRRGRRRRRRRRSDWCDSQAIVGYTKTPHTVGWCSAGRRWRLSDFCAPWIWRPRRRSAPPETPRWAPP